MMKKGSIWWDSLNP